MFRCFYCNHIFHTGEDLREHYRIHAATRKWEDLEEKLVSSLVSRYPQTRYCKEGKHYNLAANPSIDSVDAIECYTKEEMEAINAVWFELTDCKPYPDEKPGRTIFDFNTDSWVTVNSVYKFIDSCFG